MEYWKNRNYLIGVILLTICVYLNEAQLSTEYSDFCSNDCQTRFANLRCLQQYSRADSVHYSASKETSCYLQCFLYKAGLMHLKTRGLDLNKFQDIWDHIEKAFEGDSCIEKFNFMEPLSGNCMDCYRKLMEFREHCLELFEYTFTTKSTWNSQQVSKPTKSIGQSATEFCDSIDGEQILATETSQDEDVSFFTQYKENLQCIFQNFHYLDAYGRVDESEVLLSYQEANVDTPESRAIIKDCSHKANSKFRRDFYGDMVLELQSCLKTQSSVYPAVHKLRDKTSQQY